MVVPDRVIVRLNANIRNPVCFMVSLLAIVINPVC
jgi:hypothetical protein